jgi:hypothetical protein
MRTYYAARAWISSSVLPRVSTPNATRIKPATANDAPLRVNAFCGPTRSNQRSDDDRPWRQLNSTEDVDQRRRGGADLGRVLL